MMKKISKMTFAELTPYVTATAEPARRLFADAAVCSALDNMRQQISKEHTVKDVLNLFIKMVVPALLNEHHQDDICAILAAANGEKSAEDIRNADAAPAILELFALLVVDPSLEYMFRASA